MRLNCPLSAISGHRTRSEMDEAANRRRWQAFTGRDAVHIDTGLTFEEVTSDRRDPVLARSNRRVRR